MKNLVLFLLMSIFFLSCEKEYIQPEKPCDDVEELYNVELTDLWVLDGGSETLYINNHIDHCSIIQYNYITNETCYGNMPLANCRHTILNICGNQYAIEILEITEFSLIIWFPGLDVTKYYKRQWLINHELPDYNSN